MCQLHRLSLQLLEPDLLRVGAGPWQLPLSLQPVDLFLGDSLQLGGHVVISRPVVQLGEH